MRSQRFSLTSRSGRERLGAPGVADPPPPAPSADDPAWSHTPAGPPSTPKSPKSETIIEPYQGFRAFGFHELWEYRELLYFLVWRDIKVRYKQTTLGIAWAVVQPLVAMIIFTLFFGRLVKVPSDGVPYPAFSYTGLVFWTFFAQSLSLASTSVLTAAELITKVYFPRIALPLSAVLGGLVDLLIALPLVFGFLAYYSIAPSPRLLLLPLLILLAITAAAGFGIWLSAIIIELRDIRHVVPFLVQSWLFFTPVIYPSSVVVPKLRELGLPPWILGLNPMAGVVEGSRWALLGIDNDPALVIVCSALISTLVLATGMLYFRKVERSVAEIV